MNQNALTLDSAPIKAYIADADGLELSSTFDTAVTMGQGLPKTRNGKPAFYFWKESLRPGKIRDSKGNKWEIEDDDINAIVEDVTRAMKLGHEPSLPSSHKPSQSKNYGWVKGIRKNGRGNIELLHQHVGEAENNEALNKKTSVMIVPNFTDERDRNYRWWLDHNSILPNPQLRDLDDFKPALAASNGQAVDAVYLTLAAEDIIMDLTTIRTALGKTAEGKKDDEVLALCAETLTSSAGKVTELTTANADLTTKLEAEKTAVKTAVAAKDEAAKALALASKDPDEDEPSPQLIAMGKKSAIGSIELALTNGGLTTKQAEHLKTRVNAAPVLALSADAETDSPIEELIKFASLGASDPRPNKPLQRGNPAKALALSGDEVDKTAKDVSPERLKELQQMAGIVA